jgi:hypothetical protein
MASLTASLVSGIMQRQIIGWLAKNEIWWTWKEAIAYLIWGTIPAFVCRDWVKPRETSLKIVDIRAKVRSPNLPNSHLTETFLTRVFGMYVSTLKISRIIEYPDWGVFLIFQSPRAIAVIIKKDATEPSIFLPVYCKSHPSISFDMQ